MAGEEQRAGQGGRRKKGDSAGRNICNSSELYESCQKRFGREVQEEEEEEPEIETTALEEDKRVCKRIVEEGYGPNLMPGDEICVFLSIDVLRARQDTQNDDEGNSDFKAVETLHGDDSELTKIGITREPVELSLRIGESVAKALEKIGIQVDRYREETCGMIEAGLRSMTVGEFSALFMNVDKNEFDFVEDYQRHCDILFVQIKVVAKDQHPLEGCEGMWVKFDHPQEHLEEGRPKEGDIGKDNVLVVVVVFVVVVVVVVAVVLSLLWIWLLVVVVELVVEMMMMEIVFEYNVSYGGKDVSEHDKQTSDSGHECRVVMSYVQGVKSSTHSGELD
eukprot:766353-Hanusia_phi.AAC.1